ncbi:MAG TPA: rRNA maturation RNase YbeY [Candidatus Saccharimonadales bacterium]|nr:rRNA maturation RNase YbeY [Candidatus Saccharimonadales bacterium]
MKTQNSKLKINLVSEVPAELEIEPLERMVAVLNQIDPPWLRAGTINLKLVSDKVIKQLNREYAGNDYATDVLSFSYIENQAAAEAAPFDPTELGDMVISLETARRQATAAGTSLSDEMALLALHASLHIFGFDHAEVAQAAGMDALQANILAQAGVPYRDFKWTK